jgi:hypothetical protein
MRPYHDHIPPFVMRPGVITLDSFHFPITNSSILPYFAIPPAVLASLYSACLYAPRNPYSGHRFLVTIIVDDTRAQILASQVFSLRAAKLPRSAVWFVSFGTESCKFLARWDCNVIFFNGSSVGELERYKMKLVMAAIITHFPLECFILDSDIVLFDEFLRIWRYGCDVEFSSNDCLAVSLDQFWRGVEINSGCVRWAPTIGAQTFIRKIWNLVPSIAPTRDQAVINAFLHGRRLSRALWALRLGQVTIVYSIIEPWRVPNGGLLFCLGRDRLCNYARNMGIKMPSAVHFNYHIPMMAKARTLRLLNLTIEAAAARGWADFEWPFWENCKWPHELVCKDLWVNITDSVDEHSLAASLPHERRRSQGG